MLFLLSKCLATPKHLFQKPLWPYDYFRTKTQVSRVSCRFSRKSIPQEKHNGMMGRWVAIDPMPGRRILYGGELGGPQIPKVITAGAQRPWPMVQNRVVLMKMMKLWTRMDTFRVYSNFRPTQRMDRMDLVPRWKRVENR